VTKPAISPDSTVTKSAFLKRLATIIILLDLCVVFLAGLSLHHSRLQYETRAAVETGNLALALEQQIESFFDKVDLVLHTVVDETEHELAAGGIDGRKLNGFMARQSSLLPELVYLRMVNAQGDIVLGMGISAGSVKNVSDRDYFVRLRNDPRAGLVISPPLVSRVSGQMIIVLVRRVNHPDGSFAGAVIGAIPVEKLRKFIMTLDVGRHGAISLRDGGLGIIVRQPEPGRTGSAVGRKEISREFRKMLTTGLMSGTFKAAAPVDGIERTYTFRRFPHYPLYVNVGLATRDYLMKWREEVMKMSAAVLLFLLTSLLLCILHCKYRNREKAAFDALVRQETKFRTVADHTHDWEFWVGPDGDVVYTSPSCERLTGYDAAAFYSDPGLMARIVHPDDRELYDGAEQEGPPAENSGSLVFRINRPDGSVRWLERVNRPIIDSEGRFLGIRGSCRDISKRKRAEQRLAELNSCFLSFGADTGKNIDRLVALCGEQMGAACAVYSREDGEFLRAVSTWNTPPDFDGETPGPGRICYDVFHASGNDVTVLRDLQTSGYAVTDPKVSRYGITTYMGRTVSFCGMDTGLLCTVYQDGRVPGEEDKELLGIIASAIGVEEERMRALQALQESEATLRSITGSTRDAIIMIDGLGRVSFWNDTALRTFGWTETEALGRDLHELVIPERYRESYLRGIVPFSFTGTGKAIGKTLELHGTRYDGTEIPVELSLSAVRLKGQWHAVGILRDISERKRAEAEIERMAYHDALTGLPNRLLLDDRLRQSIAHAARTGHMTAVLFLDLDNFKSINDSLGHPVGDRLLKKVVKRLNDRLRNSDTVARMGGDEFIVVLSEVFVPEDAAHAARYLLDGFSEPFELDEQDIYTSASIGISLFPVDGTDTATLLKNADMAMYQAKKHGRNSFHFYTDEINRRAEERLLIENELRHAVVREEFVLHYQPWLDLKTGYIGGLEALIRWDHPQHGLIPPNRFITIAEETGLIIPIGDWVLKTACAFLDELQRAGFGGLTMCINVSGRQLRNPNLIGLLGLVLAEAGFEPSQLELELTESSVMENVEESRRHMDAFKMLGVRLALDDFGTGYSSLSYLKRFPLDRLKIDRSFVRDCPASDDDVAIARAVIALARSLNLQVTAEGVETLDQADFFSREKCDVIQGNLIGRPVEGSEFLEIMTGLNP
jgi:diguanylate cyclase (GGDEF)-like protein/PAS domain S-box-containing protein